jgi:hypothetical protein
MIIKFALWREISGNRSEYPDKIGKPVFIPNKIENQVKNGQFS